ncbi:hypothetical protein Fcan01_17910 [Folsomia candida]|uniref:Uncharacterized protein n=1 Tax=Folsomia candida TaxID=158441 RepID=A0A226DNW2_FOLCA|nr:hypothetical protein Fcan01_17910 [Folsomia candida]
MDTIIRIVLVLTLTPHHSSSLWNTFDLFQNCNIILITHHRNGRQFELFPPYFHELRRSNPSTPFVLNQFTSNETYPLYIIGKDNSSLGPFAGSSQISVAFLHNSEIGRETGSHGLSMYIDKQNAVLLLLNPAYIFQHGYKPSDNKKFYYKNYFLELSSKWINSNKNLHQRLVLMYDIYPSQHYQCHTNRVNFKIAKSFQRCAVKSLSEAFNFTFLPTEDNLSRTEIEVEGEGQKGHQNSPSHEKMDSSESMPSPKKISLKNERMK